MRAEIPPEMARVGEDAAAPAPLDEFDVRLPRPKRRRNAGAVHREREIAAGRSETRVGAVEERRVGAQRDQLGKKRPGGVVRGERPLRPGDGDVDVEAAWEVAPTCVRELRGELLVAALARATTPRRREWMR